MRSASKSKNGAAGAISRPRATFTHAVGESAGAEFREVTSEERRQLIAEAAYYRAERRSFTPGNELADWLDAEAEIEKKLARTHS